MNEQVNLLAPELSNVQEAQLLNLKAHFPFRYCFAAFNIASGDFQTWAMFNYPSRKMSALSKKGYILYELAK